MSVVLCTLCLNEMQWLPRLYKQHKDWPDMLAWIFVESADKVYADANPALVTSDGLSVDGTTDFLSELALKDDRIVHARYGFCGMNEDKDKAQGKCEARSHYLELADGLAGVTGKRIDHVMVIDADEFYPKDDQHTINVIMRKEGAFNSFVFKQRHIWYPPSLVEMDAKGNPMRFEVSGGFWDIPHCRGWRYHKGMRYIRNHNTPEINGRFLDRHQLRVDKLKAGPECVHMGFASSVIGRAAKHRYYADRGETKDPRRNWYVDSRRAWETWQPGEMLPRGAAVIPYTGKIPECFQC